MKQTLSGQTAYNLTLAANEMDIGYVYREFLSRKITGLHFTSPFKCDGFGVHENLKIRLLCEFKDKYELKKRTDFASILAQAVCYVKKFELSGIKLPTTILLGDRDEFCVLHTNEIIQFLAMPFDWETAPSNVNVGNPELVEMIFKDEKINPFIFSVTQLDDVVSKIKELTENVKRLIPITNHNITEVFNYFLKNILGKTTLSTNELANLFVQILVNPTENYLHPITKIPVIVTKSFNQIPIKSRKAYQSFFEHFKSEYAPKEKEVLTSIVDRLVEDTTRRKQGEFFTPTIWVDKAHEYITSVFGEDWKEKYVVWDPAWGTGNLTRDYKFKELYVSTLNQSDIDTANQMGYNSEAVKFQFDFLNDPDDKLPQGLRDAIENGKEIIVFMNPPYGRTTGIGGRFSNISIGATTTKVSEEMKRLKISGSDNFYTQFLFKCVKINLNNLCTFTPSNFQTGESFKSFRKYFYNKIDLKKGFIFQASNFDDVSDDWSIQFSLFKKGTYKTIKEMDVLKEDKNFLINKIGEKILTSTDNQKSLKNWVEVDNTELVEFPKLSSAFNIKESKWGCGVQKGFLGTLVNNSNSPSKNGQSVYFINGGVTENVGKIFLTEKNFFKVCSIFSSRRLINGDWKNWYDEYLSPNEQHELFEQFKYDSVIYSLFESKSNQSSLRQIEYKEKLWDIKNEFFWMSKEEMLNLANENNYSDLYNDARTDSDRHVYKLLFGEERIYDKLSPDAKLVLDKATELVKKSMSLRGDFANHENHLSSWDAGYAQLKLIWKECYADEFKEFRELYKNLEDRMRPLVYELGFLMK